MVDLLARVTPAMVAAASLEMTELISLGAEEAPRREPGDFLTLEERVEGELVVGPRRLKAFPKPLESTYSGSAMMT